MFFQSNHARELFSLLLPSTLAITSEHQHASHIEMFYLQYPMKHHTFCPVGTNMRPRIDYMPLINPKTVEINQEYVCKRKSEREWKRERKRSAQCFKNSEAATGEVL